MRKYILDEQGNPKQVQSILEWDKWMSSRETKNLAKDPVPGGYVYTTFLGIDHSFGNEGNPILWETMSCINGEWDNQQRYRTREEALEGHKKLLNEIRNKLNIKE